MVFDFMTTGQAVPAAVGAALADGGRTICAFEGDASFMMHVQEIDTAARYGAAPLIFVINDEALGAEYHKLRALGLDPAESLVPMPDVVRLVEALGGRSMRIERPEDVRVVMDWYDPAGGPHVVDCPVTRSVVGPE
jgi:thiamine pyrophosphate-dependent acetolactate synthase large subunit-like protein